LRAQASILQGEDIHLKKKNRKKRTLFRFFRGFQFNHAGWIHLRPCQLFCMANNTLLPHFQDDTTFSEQEGSSINAAAVAMATKEREV